MLIFTAVPLCDILHFTVLTSYKQNFSADLSFTCWWSLTGLLLTRWGFGVAVWCQDLMAQAGAGTTPKARWSFPARCRGLFTWRPDGKRTRSVQQNQDHSKQVRGLQQILLGGRWVSSCGGGICLGRGLLALAFGGCSLALLGAAQIKRLLFNTDISDLHGGHKGGTKVNLYVEKNIN